MLLRAVGKRLGDRAGDQPARALAMRRRMDQITIVLRRRLGLCRRRLRGVAPAEEIAEQARDSRRHGTPPWIGQTSKVAPAPRWTSIAKSRGRPGGLRPQAAAEREGSGLSSRC